FHKRRRQIAPSLDSLLNRATGRLKLIRSMSRSATSLTEVSDQIFVIRATLSHDAVNIGHRDTQVTRSSFKAFLRILGQINFRTELAERFAPETLLPEAEVWSLNSFNQPTQDRSGNLSHLGHLRKFSADQLRRSSQAIALKRAGSTRNRVAQGVLRLSRLQRSLSHVLLRGLSVIRRADQA